MSRELQIDEEFKNLIPPLSADEFSRLEKSILVEGVREPIITWNGVIVDGHNRYAICQKHAIEYENRERQFESRDAAKIWIIENQFGRRNLNNYQRSALALELEPLYAAEAERRMLAGKANPPKNSSEGAKGETREKVAKAAGVSHDTIRKVKTIEAEAAKGNEKAVKVRNELMSGERKSIHGGYTEVCGKQKPRKKSEMVLEDGRMICRMCGEPVDQADAHPVFPSLHRQCQYDYTNDNKRLNGTSAKYERKYRDADKDLRENVAVFNRASLIAELKGSAQMLDESWHQSLEINETQGVKLTKSEVNSLFNAIDHLYNAIKDIQKEG